MADVAHDATGTDLRWVTDVLWPDAAVEVAIRRPHPTDFVVLPGKRRARLLAPAGHPAAARLLLGHGGSGHHPLRLRARRAGAGIAAGLLHGPVPLPVVGDGTETWLVPEARARLDDAHAIGVRLGSVRPNRKPVLLASTPDGDLVGAGKVGWSPRTRALVRQIERRLSTIRSDDVLHVAESRGITERGGVVVQWQTALPLARAAATVPDELLGRGLHRIGSMGPGSEHRLSDAPYATDLVRRAEATGRPRVIEAVQRAIGDVGDAELSFGTWHGDFSRWNLAAIDGRLAVWDWERTADDVPLGMDALHLHLSLASLAQSGSQEVERARMAASDLLSTVGVPGPARHALSRLHLAELLLRLADHPPAARLASTLLRLVAGPT